MYRGYPVGHLLFWDSGAEPGARQIGGDSKQLAPRLLIVNGQQRLTSLFAVMKQRPVVGKDYAKKRIQIAFRPRDETFAVADAATARDPLFFQDVGEIWARPAYQVITEFLARLRESDALDGDDEQRIPAALGRLESLKAYPFTALVLGADIDEERVADVFVRINSKGKNLNQADFILTLMSVFWEEGRTALERWSRGVRVPGDPAYNAYLAPEPDHSCASRSRSGSGAAASRTPTRCCADATRSRGRSRRSFAPPSSNDSPRRSACSTRRSGRSSSSASCEPGTAPPRRSAPTSRSSTPTRST